MKAEGKADKDGQSKDVVRQGHGREEGKGDKAQIGSGDAGQRERHVKYLRSLVKRLTHIDLLREQEAGGKTLLGDDKVKAGKRSFVYAELRAALTKTQSDEWKEVDLSFLGKYAGEPVSPNYIMMMQVAVG